MNPFFIPLSVLTICLPATAREARSELDEDHRPPPNPIFEALDQDGDHRLSKEEIANATTVLQELDKNGDGQLDPHEVHPRRPDGDHPPQASEEFRDAPPHPPHGPRDQHR